MCDKSKAVNADNAFSHTKMLEARDESVSRNTATWTVESGARLFFNVQEA
jgi:hypothetical protein